MKIPSILLTAVCLAVVSATAGAQTRPVTPPAAPAPDAQGTVKIAVIYSDEFQNEKTGIARFTATMKTLNAEFDKIQKDLNSTQTRLQQMQDELVKLQNGPNPDAKVIQTKMDQLEQLKKDYQRKGEDAQSSYAKRRQDLFQPLQDDIGKALETFAKARGITVLIDGSAVPVIYAAENIDITRAFIADYNTKNPATAALGTPR